MRGYKAGSDYGYGQSYNTPPRDQLKTLYCNIELRIHHPCKLIVSPKFWDIVLIFYALPHFIFGSIHCQTNLE